MRRYRRYAITSRDYIIMFPCDSLVARISMQNRNRGGFEVANTFDNDTPRKGSMIIGASQSGLLTITTDDFNWRF